MPRRLERSIGLALRDDRLDVKELTALVEAAKADDVLSPDERSRLEALLATHGDKFDEKTRRMATAFLEGGTAAVSPGPLPDPKLSWDTTDPVELRAKAAGVLAIDGFHYDDVVQNELGDCFLLASLSALAAVNPRALEQAITDHGDGTYTVRFFEKQGRGPMRPVEVRVDGDLPTKADGTLAYASSRQDGELWPSLVEKAYAAWKGGYGELSLGGYAGDALSALTGAKADFHNPIQALEARELWALMQAAHASGRALVTGTGASLEGRKADGLVTMHMYSVVGVSEENGERFVTLRNPYGKVEPGADGANDGVFRLTFREYRKYFEDLYVLAA